jgi:hypothetical protein
MIVNIVFEEYFKPRTDPRNVHCRKPSFLCFVARASRYNSGKWPTWRAVLFSYMFISILYMFRTTSYSSSGESILSIQRLVYVTLCRWPSSMQVGKELRFLHTRRSPTQSDIYQKLYWYNWFSWWWARGCSKHVENWNKHIRKKNCASSWSFTGRKPSVSTHSTTTVWCHC